jgi:hypothetical protein
MWNFPHKNNQLKNKSKYQNWGLTMHEVSVNDPNLEYYFCVALDISS